MAGRLALTGATGFIGGALALRLQTQGWEVRALVRPNARRRRLPEGVIQVPGSLEDPASLQRLVQGVDAVVHCAGAVRGRTPVDFGRPNVAGVSRLAQTAARQDRPPRFLSVSSLAAREPGLSPYAASKRAGESALAAAAGSMPWLALRPPAVYGPGDRELLPLFRLMRRGVAPLLGTRHARLSLLYVDDLVEAVLRWLSLGQCERGVLELHDGRPGGYRWDDVVEVGAALRGKALVRLSVPTLPLRVAAAVNLSAARLLGYAPMLTPGKLRELRHPDWVCDNAAITRVTGWKPRVGFTDGLRRTLDWPAGAAPQAAS